MCASQVCFAASPAELNGASNISTEEITLSNGTKTGVTVTELILPHSTYYNPSNSQDKKACFTEFDLSNTNLSVEVINCGNSLVEEKTVKTAVENYKVNGQTVLAAINGDLWMTSVHSNAEMSKKVLKVSRGIMIADGEIWASQQIGMENACATNDERGTTTPPKAAFGVTTSNQPIVGSPNITVSVKNETKNVTLNGDGINRLPAPDSAIIYNHRCYTTNYALNDSYEIEIEASNTAFSTNGTVSGTVKAIYESGSTTRPTIGKNTILITVRGSKISTFKNSFSVGDKVSFKCDITDTLGNTQLWKNVTEAIGGHIMVRRNGEVYTQLGGNTEYPAAFIGYKDDGTVMFTTLTANKDGVRLGVNYSTAAAFLEQCGYNTVFFLDGGGSATTVTLKDGSYTVRSKSSDGSPRSVINAIAVVWNDKKVCAKQGSLSYIKTPDILKKIPGYHIPADLMPELANDITNCTLQYDEKANSFNFNVLPPTNDAYAQIAFSPLGEVSADDYKYMVVKTKNNFGSQSMLRLFYSTSVSPGPSALYTVSKRIDGDNQWHYYVYDLSYFAGWKGTIKSIRFDPFDSDTIPAGKNVVFSLGSITLCKTADEAAKVATGKYLPKGAVSSYQDFLENRWDTSTEIPTDTSSEDEDTIIEDTVVEDTIVEDTTIGNEDTVVEDTAIGNENTTNGDTANESDDTIAEDTISDDSEAEEESDTAGNESSQNDDEEKDSKGISKNTLAVIICVGLVAVGAVAIVLILKKK